MPTIDYRRPRGAAMTGCAAARPGRQSEAGCGQDAGGRPTAKQQHASRVTFEQRFQVAALHTLYAYWQELRGNRRAPARAEIDLARIAPVLPNIAIFDVEESPRRYRIRLMGTRNVTWYGADPTGCYLDEIDIGAEGNTLCALLDRIVELVVPGHVTGEYIKHDGRVIRFERLFMPLSNDGRRIDMLIGAVCQLPPDAPLDGASLDLPETSSQAKGPRPD